MTEQTGMKTWRKMVLVKEIAGQADVVQAIITDEVADNIVEALNDGDPINFVDVDGDQFWIAAGETRHILVRELGADDMKGKEVADGGTDE